MLLRTQVVHAAGSGRLEQLTLAQAQLGSHVVPAAALFILIGSEPRTQWLEGTPERDAAGFVLTGRELSRTTGAAFPLAREPLLRESSMPGVFAAGDVQANSVKRIATAVGEGSQVIRMIQDYLGER